MLYCANDMRWKIADFGLTTEATSKRAHTTRYARGTPSYRAPELLKEDSKYNNKVDIFAMGCILFELATGRKAFRDDFSIHEYSISHSEFDLFPLIDSENHQPILPLISAMLSKTDLKRPSARDLQSVFAFHLSLSLADKCRIIQEYPAAIKAYEFATLQRVTGYSNGPLLRELGACYKAIDNYERAKLCYQLAIEAGLTATSLYSDLGDLCTLSQDHHSAASYYTLARVQAPGNTELLRKLVFAYTSIAVAEIEVSHYEDAIASYQAALEIDPSNLHLWECCGDTYMLKKDYDEAIKIFKIVMKKFPGQCIQKLGRVYLESGNPDAAVKVYKTALKKNPTSEAFLVSLEEARAAMVIEMDEGKRDKDGNAWSWFSRLSIKSAAREKEVDDVNAANNENSSIYSNTSHWSTEAVAGGWSNQRRNRPKAWPQRFLSDLWDKMT